MSDKLTVSEVQCEYLKIERLEYKEESFEEPINKNLEMEKFESTNLRIKVRTSFPWVLREINFKGDSKMSKIAVLAIMRVS